MKQTPGHKSKTQEPLVSKQGGRLGSARFETLARAAKN
jgi:hypothetical protein